MTARPVWIGPLLCLPLGPVPEYDGAEAVMAHRYDVEVEVGKVQDQRAEIHKLRGLLTQAREEVVTSRNAYTEWGDHSAATEVAALLALIDSALSAKEPA